MSEDFFPAAHAMATMPQRRHPAETASPTSSPHPPPTSTTEPATDATNDTERAMLQGTRHADSAASQWNRRSIAVLAGAVAVNMVTFGWVSSTGFFINYYKTHQFSGASDLQLSWLSGTGLALMYVASWPVAWLSSVVNPAMIIAAGSVTHLLGLVLLVRSTSLWAVLLTQGFVTPLGASMVFNATIPVLTQWFRRNTSLPVGITAAGSSVGGMLYPVLISYLLPVDGFEETLIRAIAVLAGLLIFVAFTVQLPRNTDIRETRRILAGTQLVEPLREPYFVLFAAASAMFLGGYAIIMAFLVNIAQGVGVQEPWRVLVILNGSGFVGRIVPLLVAGRLGRYNTLAFLTGLSAILTLALLYPTTNTGTATVAFSVSWGISAGAFISLVPATVAQSSPHEQIGLRIGITYFFLATTALTWPGIAASIGGRSDGGLVLFSGLSQALGCVLYLSARCVQTGLPSITVI